MMLDRDNAYDAFKLDEFMRTYTFADSDEIT